MNIIILLKTKNKNEIASKMGKKNQIQTGELVI